MPQHGTFPATFALFALYGPASAAFVYLCSFVFKSHSAAQNTVLLLNLGAVIALLVVNIMEFIPRSVCGGRPIAAAGRTLTAG